ncbi:MAG: hypothetical protein MR303_03110 [Emergencia sp.]|nr:hypothetical protein [Emergencia sp.]
MKYITRKTFLVLSICFILCFGNIGYVFAEDIDYSENESIEIPIFNSVPEAMQELNQEPGIQPFGAGDEGGMADCTITPFMVRVNSMMENCTLYLKYNATFRVKTVRFKELIVEKSYLIGKNYLKLVPKSGQSYYKVELDSYYSGYRTVSDNVMVPLDVKNVYIRTKDIGVYRIGENPGWLSCQYQITGVWSINPKRPF